MFTTGSKLLIGGAVVTALIALAYGLSQEGTLGTLGLVSAAAALAFLATINVYARDSNVSAMDTAGLEASPAAQPAPGASMWPLVGAVGAVLVAVGLVTTQIVFVLGLAVLLLATVEWLVQGWSERASADRSYNDVVRERLAGPLELPILAAVAFGVVIYFLSRVMLTLDRTATVVAFALVAALLLVIAFLLAFRRSVSTSTIGGVVAVAVVALVAGGAAAALNGEREMHEHETTGDLGERGRCGAEETEADEDASQDVAAKSNVAAVITLGDDGLTFDQPGFVEPGSTLTLPRANASNVIFENETPEPRRLAVDVGPTGEQESTVLCTALVEEGGRQLLTVRFDTPSFAVDEPFQFTVPGVDGTALEVIIP